MKIQNWEGVALIIGAGDIGNCIFDYLSTIAPKLDVRICGRNIDIQNGIFLTCNIGCQDGFCVSLMIF